MLFVQMMVLAVVGLSGALVPVICSGVNGQCGECSLDLYPCKTTTDSSDYDDGGCKYDIIAKLWKCDPNYASKDCTQQDPNDLSATCTSCTESYLYFRHACRVGHNQYGLCWYDPQNEYSKFKCVTKQRPVMSFDRHDPAIRNCVVGSFITTTVGYGNTDHWFTPNDVAVADDDTIYVVDYAIPAIRIIHPNGTLGFFAYPVDLDDPRYIAVEDNAVYLTDIGTGSEPSSVKIFDRRTRDLVYIVLALEGDAFSGHIAVRDEKVYVVDTWNNRIHKIYKEAETWTVTHVSVLGQLNHPIGIAVDSQSKIYVSDADGLYRIDTVYLTRLSQSFDDWRRSNPDKRDQQFHFRSPEGIAVNSDGTHIVGVFRHGIYRFVLDTNDSSIALGGDNANREPGFANGDANTSRFYEPRGVAIASNGDVYVADRDNKRLRLIEMDSRCQESRATATTTTQPSGSPSRTVLGKSREECSSEGSEQSLNHTFDHRTARKNERMN
eukprot:GEMP01030619.1.p1 GENE.GEMP01030619.1~~GEMP01030619.1.p1  ORF type:complete len:494 (+),score=37.47 GEMP01030619.1:57-1538(+)